MSEKPALGSGIRKKELIPVITSYKKVGVKYPPLDNPNLSQKYWKPFSYLEVEADIDGWVDAERFLPIDYDLVLMKIEGQKVIPGWMHGITWDGLKYKSGQKVLYWKRKIDREEV